MSLQSDIRTPRLTITYCYRSPFCALVVDALFRLAVDYDIAMEWRLVEETPRPSSLPITIDNPRFAYNRQDCARRARWLGLSWNPPDWRLRDVRTATAIGQSLLLRESPLFEPFSVMVSRAYWCDRRDISDPSVAVAIARELGVDPALVEDAVAENADVQARLDENAARCQDEGVLGVPFFEISGERFWGSDRLSDLRIFLDERSHARTGLSGSRGA